MGQKRKQYSAACKFKIALEAAKNGRTVSQIASENNIHPNQVSAWRKRLLSEGKVVFERKSNRQQKERATKEAALYEQIGRLKMELEWLKKTNDVV